MTVKADVTVKHFGEFLRARIMGRGRITDVAKEHGLSTASLYRFFRAQSPEPLNIEHYNKVAIAKAAGFESWDAFDGAWQSTPVVPIERRSKPSWGASAAAIAKWEQAGGKFDFSDFTAEQCKGIIEAAKRRLDDLGVIDDEPTAKPTPRRRGA